MATKSNKTDSIVEKEEKQPEIKKTIKVIELAPPPTYGQQEELDNNDVYDEGDIASALERGFIAHALSKHKEKVAPEKHPDFDGENCIDCGNEVPIERLRLGRIRCVYCQTELEKRNKIYGR